MTRKHKGNKHEEARKALPASAPRAPAKAAKLAPQATPRPAKLSDVEQSSPATTRLLIQVDESESGLQDTLSSFELQVIDSLESESETSSHIIEIEAAKPVTDSAHSSSEPYLPILSRCDAAPSSDCDLDLVYKSAEEQVALAMLEAEQAAALCQWSGDVPPFLYLEGSLDFAGPHPFVPEFVSKASVESMDSASEDEPFAFDHI